MSPGAGRRGRGNFLGCHHQMPGDLDVGAAGADRAAAVGLRHKLAERVRQAARDPVPHHHAGAQGRLGQEPQRRGQR